MTDTTATTAPAVATTTIAQEQPAAVAPEATAPATDAAAAPPVEGAAEEQPRAENGRFVKRTEKLQSQIDNLTAEKRQAEREVLALRNQALALKKQLSEQAPPDPNDYDAQTRHHISSALKEERLAQTESAAEQAAERAEAAKVRLLRTQADELKAHIPDIDKIFAPVEQGGPAITRVMAEGISRAENGALVAHYLMKNPNDAMRIANLDPISALVEVGLIAARIKPTEMKRISQAPAPVPTVSGGSSSPVVDISSMAFGDYEKMRLKQMAESGR